MGEPIKGNSRYGSVETEEMDFGGRMDTVGIGRSWEELRNFRRGPRGGGGTKEAAWDEHGCCLHRLSSGTVHGEQLLRPGDSIQCLDH